MKLEIDATDLAWLEGMDEKVDRCLHGKAFVKIGDEILEDVYVAVSAAALYLLRTLTDNHITNGMNISVGSQMIPCCVFSMYADKSLENVDIIGCNAGTDWSVIHIDNKIKLTTENGTKVTIVLEEYRKIAYAFADKIEDYYNKGLPKTFNHEVDFEGYTAFWNEWHKTPWKINEKHIYHHQNPTNIKGGQRPPFPNLRLSILPTIHNKIHIHIIFNNRTNSKLKPARHLFRRHVKRISLIHNLRRKVGDMDESTTHIFIMLIAKIQERIHHIIANIRARRV